MSHENTKHEEADMLTADQGLSSEEKKNVPECKKHQFVKRNLSNPMCTCMNKGASKPGKQTFAKLGGGMGKPTVVAGDRNNYPVSHDRTRARARVRRVKLLV